MSDKAAKLKIKPKKGFNPVLVLVPIALIAAAVLAFALPPSHKFIVDGPLKPVFARFLPPGSKDKLAARTQTQTPDPALDVKRLNAAVEDGKRSAAEKDARIAQLQSQLDQVQKSPAPTPAPAVKPSPSPVPEALKRVGAYWAEMDAEKAAQIAAKLPSAYVGRVFSTMPADAVGEIMNALPPKAAAALAPASEEPVLAPPR